MLKVSQKLEYAIRAMIELAEHRDDEALTPAREIAERQQVPLRFLEQQLGALSKRGVGRELPGRGRRVPARARSRRHHRGRGGRRDRGPDLSRCSASSPPTTRASQDSRCGLQGFWADVARAVQDVFERTTVADLSARHRKMAPGPVMLSPEQLLSRLN